MLIEDNVEHYTLSGSDINLKILYYQNIHKFGYTLAFHKF